MLNLPSSEYCEYLLLPLPQSRNLRRESSLIFFFRDPLLFVSALQGSFAEHIASINSLPLSYNVHATSVRTPTELARCKGLIIPGGESTAISLLITKSGLYEPLREFVRSAKAGEGKSIWGTCAGMILLAKEIEGPTSEGWKGLDGIDVRVGRNSYGRQVSSLGTR